MAWTSQFIRTSAVRTLIKKRGRRAGLEFLKVLDRHVERKVESACAVHNGGKKTLGVTVAAHVGVH